MSEQGMSTHLGPYKRWEKVVIIFLLVTGLVVVSYYCIGISLFLNNNENWCINQHEETFVSPDNKYKAIYFLRNCGATEGYKPEVSLLLSDEVFDQKTEGNIFQCYRCSCTEVTWISERDLLVEYCWPSGTGLDFESPDDFLTTKETQMYDVNITFELIQK